MPLAGPGVQRTPTAVSVDSEGKAWSVGYTSSNATASPAAFRYEGGAWVPKPLPASGTGELINVAARTPKDVRAGGFTSSGTGLWHYDGEGWTQMTNPGEWPETVLQIIAASQKDVWFYAMPRDPLFRGPDLVHWDGSAFTVTQTPSPVVTDASEPTTKSAGGFLGSIASDGQGGIWLQDSRTAYYRHFDGTTWTNVPRPPNGLGGWPVVNSLVQIGHTRSVWGVGQGANDLLLIDRFR